MARRGLLNLKTMCCVIDSSQAAHCCGTGGRKVDGTKFSFLFSSYLSTYERERSCSNIPIPTPVTYTRDHPPPNQSHSSHFPPQCSIPVPHPSARPIIQFQSSNPISVIRIFQKIPLPIKMNEYSWHSRLIFGEIPPLCRYPFPGAKKETFLPSTRHYHGVSTISVTLDYQKCSSLYLQDAEEPS